MKHEKVLPSFTYYSPSFSSLFFSVFSPPPPSSPFLHFSLPLSPPPLFLWCLAQLTPRLKGLGVNPSQFSSLRAPIKKGLSCVICHTIVPSPSSFAPAPPPPSAPPPSKSFQPDLSDLPFSSSRDVHDLHRVDLL